MSLAARKRTTSGGLMYWIKMGNYVNWTCEIVEFWPKSCYSGGLSGWTSLSAPWIRKGETFTEVENSVPLLWPLFVAQLRFVAKEFSSGLGYIDADLQLEKLFWVRHVPNRSCNCSYGMKGSIKYKKISQMSESDPWKHISVVLYPYLPAFAHPLFVRPSE